MKLILFDIDGTLTRSNGAGRGAFDKIFSRLFDKHSVSDGMSFAGKTDPMIIQEIFQRHFARLPSIEELSLIKEGYMKAVHEDTIEQPCYNPVEGVLPVLESIAQDKNALLGLATGNFEETAQLKLKSAKIEHYFHFGGFGSDSPIRKDLTQLGIEKGKRLIPKDKTLDSVFVIGDTIHDVNAGNACEAITIGITTGATTKEEFAQHSPNYILESYEPTEKVLEILKNS